MVLVSSALAVVGGVIVLGLVSNGPFTTPPAPFDPRAVIHSPTQGGVRLANFGYLGHMWELYAMWTWVPVFLVVALEERSGSASLAWIIAFAVIAVGGVGSVVAGALAGRLGRTVITFGVMIVSGSMAILAAGFFDAPLAYSDPDIVTLGTPRRRRLCSVLSSYHGA